MTSTATPIHFGDYVYLIIQPDANSDGYVMCSDGFYSSNICAGRQQKLNVRSYRNCLFQILPNQHSASYPLVKASETQFNLLKTLNPSNKTGFKYLGEQLNLEKTKESQREERIELLNQKEVTEALARPILYGEKFTLKHVESGMFLESTNRTSQVSECLELRLTDRPNSEMYFEVKPTSLSKKKGDVTDYTDPIKIFTNRLDNFICLGELSTHLSEKKVTLDIPLLKDPNFPPYPSRRQRPKIDNVCTKAAGSALTPHSIQLVNYLHASNDYLKTGEYIRISNESGFFTIYDIIPQPKIFFQKYESLEYQFNQINTVFQVVKAPMDFETLPVEETIQTVNPAQEELNIGESGAKSYLLRHYVSGKYLCENNGVIKLIEADEVIEALENGSLSVTVQFIAKPYREVQKMHLSTEFKLRFIRNQAPPAYFNVDSEIPVPTANFVKNTPFFFGFDIPDDYLIKKLKPTWNHVLTREKTGNQLRYVPVVESEMFYILKAENLAHHIEDFLDFCTDLRTPAERIETEKYNQKKALEEQKLKEKAEEIKKTFGVTELVTAAIDKRSKREQHERWMQEEIENQKKIHIAKKMKQFTKKRSMVYLDEEESKEGGEEKQTAYNGSDDKPKDLEKMNEEEVVLETAELEMIEDEAYFIVIERERNLGILPKDYEDTDEEEALEDYHSDDSGTPIDLENVKIEHKADRAKLNVQEVRIVKPNFEGRDKECDNDSDTKLTRGSIFSEFIGPLKTKKEAKLLTPEYIAKMNAAKKRRRRQARTLQLAVNEFSPQKYEKECLLALARHMRELQKILTDFIKSDEDSHQKKEVVPEEGLEAYLDDDEEDAADSHVDETSTLDPVKQWVVREFRIIDYINVILYDFLRAERISNIIKELQEKYHHNGEKCDEFYDFDVQSFNNFAAALIKLLFAVTTKDYLNHLYNSQFVRVYIHCLCVTDAGIYQIVPQNRLSKTREMILQCCKEFLWEEDLDAISQLNAYQADLFKAIRAEKSYEGIYIRLLDHQCRSNAPNLDNKIAALFITEFLTNEEDLTHTLPKIIEKSGQLCVQFVRQSDESLNEEISLLDLSKVTQFNPRFKIYAEYLLLAFRLVNALANLNHLVFFQTIIKHYPRSLVERAAKETSTSFFEFSTLAADVIVNVHMKYFKLPIEKFPAHIQILGDSVETQKYMADTNRIIEKMSEGLFSEYELEVLTEKGIKEEVLSLREMSNSKLIHPTTIGQQKKIKQDSRENIHIIFEKLRSFLSTSADDIPLESLRETNELFCSVLTHIVQDNIPEFANLRKKKSKKSSQVQIGVPNRIEMSRSQKQKSGSRMSIIDYDSEQPYTPDMALELLKFYGMLEGKLIKVAAIKMIENIIEQGLKKPSDAPSSSNNLDNSFINTSLSPMLVGTDNTARGAAADAAFSTFKSPGSLSLLISKQKNEWKSRRVLYPMKEKGVKQIYNKYSTDQLTKLLFELILLRKNLITREVIRELKNISKFDTKLYQELTKMALISNNADIKRVAEIISIVCRLNYYTRMHKCSEFFSKKIPEKQLRAMFAHIEQMVNFLLFSIYKARKHFRYEDHDIDPEERFLKGFAKWKAPRWDKPFKLNPEAVNQAFQKVFLTLGVPKALFELIQMTISIQEAFGKLPIDYLSVVRKAILILCAFVYRNETNQCAIYGQKYFILSYYDKKFVDQTCDVLILFSELMRDNKRLQKLPMKYLSDITNQLFLSAIQNHVSKNESDSYLCTSLMSLHFLLKIRIGGFNAERCIAQKFEQITKTLQTDNSLNLSFIYKKGQVIELPFHYYSIREFFCSWLEICKKFIKTSERLEKIFGQFRLSHWNQVLANPSLMFQFELRNLLTKTLAISWYGTKHRFKVVDQFENFKTFVFRLFADISAFIWIKSKEGVEGLEDYNFQVDSKSMFGNSLYTVQMRDFLRDFRRDSIGNAKVQVYLEEISLMNLWREYIYEGCLGLLSVMLLQEAESMMVTMDENDGKFPNLVSYYLFFLVKLAIIPAEMKENPFYKIDENLQKMSLLPEYKPYKHKIHQAAQIIRDSRPHLKMRSRMLSIKGKSEVGVEMFEIELARMLKDSKAIKESNTHSLANILSEIPASRKIVSEIILYVKKEYRKIKPSELTFILRLLRKLIERENTTPTTQPVYMWEIVKIADLQKMLKLQSLYRELGFTEFLVEVVNQVKSTNVLKEFLQMSVAYLYGGNSEVQKEYYTIFISDYNNRLINRLREALMKYADAFKEQEKDRLERLYQDSVRHTFEFLEDVHDEVSYQGNLFFDRVREGFPEELMTDCMQMKGSGMLVLLLSFLQGLAERQCKELQNFAREQTYVDEKGETKLLANSFDFLSEFRSLFNNFFKMHSKYNITIGVKLIDVLKEFIQGDVVDNVHTLLNKTLLFDMTRILTDFNNPYHLLPRGYDFDPNAGEFRELKSKVIGFIKALVEFPDKQVIERIRKYLDINGLMDVFESNMHSFFGLNQKKLVSKGVYLLASTKAKSLQMEDFNDGILMDALNIYMIFRYLWEDNHVFKEEVDELISDPKRSVQNREILEVFIYVFCAKIVKSVEIVFEGKERDLTKYWFAKLPVCNFLLESKKRKFESTVDRSNSQTKISGLMVACEGMIQTMYEDYKSSKRWLGFNIMHFYAYSRLLCNLLAIGINFVNLYALETNDDKEFFYYPAHYKTVEDTFVIINIIFASFLVIIWLLTSSKTHLSDMWEKYIETNIRESGLLPRSITKKLEDKQYDEISPEECILIFQLKGRNTDEYRTLLHTFQLRKNVRWLLVGMNLKFIFMSVTFVWHLIYLGLSFAALWTPAAATLFITDIAIQSDAIMQVFRAIVTNWKPFLWTLFLLVDITLFYTFISFYTLQNDFVTEDGTKLCEHAYGCFFSILNFGLRAGGGIADVIRQQYYIVGETSHFFKRVAFDLTFFIVMITILLNLIFGMIIDAFGNLRDQKNQNEDDAENICFICGINRSEFERYMNFEDHITKEHDKWDYIYLIVHIQEKYRNMQTEMTEIEHYVNDKCKAKNYQWFPVGRSITLEKLQEASASLKANDS